MLVRRILTLPTMSEPLPQPTEPPKGPAHPVRVFLTANFVYLWLVHYWALGKGDGGPVSATLAESTGLQHVALALAHAVLGDATTGYVVLNILLLYACMVGLFFLTRAVIGGPWWHGSLVAVLMMANPMKTDAVLALSGAQHLVPALLAILGVLLAVWPFVRAGFVAQGGALALVTIVAFSSTAYTLLPWAVVALQVAASHATPGRGGWLGRLPWLVLGAVAIAWRFAELQIAPAQSMLSLFLVVYPIGLLPGTAASIAASPTLAGLAALAVLAVWLWLWRATRHPVVLWSGVAALLLRAVAEPVGLVELEGGATMILPIALVAMGFTAMCHRIMQHPAWPRHVVFLTSAICVVYFILQIQDIQRRAVPAAAPVAVLEGA